MRNRSNCMFKVYLLQLPLLQPEFRPTEATGCGDLEFPRQPDTGNLCIVDDYKDTFKHVAMAKEEAIQARDEHSWQNVYEKRYTERKIIVITALNFAQIMIRKAAVNKKKTYQQHVKTKTFHSSSDGYGTSSENVARNMYRHKSGNHLHDSGLVINPAFPFIAASPEGKTVWPWHMLGFWKQKANFCSGIRKWATHFRMQEGISSLKLMVEILILKEMVSSAGTAACYCCFIL